MLTSRGLFGSCVVLFLVLGLLGSSWSMSPRYMLYGRARLVAVEAPNLLRLKMLEQDRVVTVRLLGVGSPRNRDRIKGLDHQVLSYIRRNDIWETARDFVRSLLDGKSAEVWIRKWDRLDDKNRLLAYVLVPGISGEPIDVNAEIIKKGLGFVTRDYVHVTFVDYKGLENEARSNRRGLWGALSEGRITSLPHQDHGSQMDNR
ncbi:MAG: thermonuclease family protein [Desulfomonile tiedjei]|nr:thermonuclease family protein [Desulfomonile tiedjei]